jgi:phosphatidylserine decarboxylase
LTKGCKFNKKKGHFPAMVTDPGYEGLLFDSECPAWFGDSGGPVISFQEGKFVTLYLAPKDYHRVHMPLSGQLREMVYIPGTLFSVNTRTTQKVPNLFARNERVVAIFDTQAGPMAIILVGAMLVASINTVWAGKITPSKQREIHKRQYHDGEVSLARSAEMGHFQLGSTVILLFGNNRIEWDAHLKAEQSVQFGQSLGIVI